MPIRTTEAFVLRQIVGRLRDAVPLLAGRACRMTDDDGPPRTVPSDPFCTVSSRGGVFTDAFAGGGADVLAEDLRLVVSLWTRPTADLTDALARPRLPDGDAGLLTLKTEVLRALLIGWDVRQRGHRCVRAALRPVRTEAPKRFDDAIQGGIVRLSLEWSVGIAWDLTEPAPS